MGAAEVTLIITLVPWSVGVLVLLYKIGNLMGQISQRLQDLERRAKAWDEAISNGYRPRPQNR